MKRWVVAAMVVVSGLVGTWGLNHHYDHYDRPNAPVTRADMYLIEDMYHAPSDMY